MSRHFLIAGAALSATLLGALALHAQPATKAKAQAELGQLFSRLPRHDGPTRASVGTAASPVSFILPSEDSLFLDHDDDGETSFGDQFLIHGPLVNERSGREVGTYEGTLAITNDKTFTANLTLLFPGGGTVVINGAPYPDGARSDVFLAPVVGVTGRMSADRQAGFFNDRRGRLGVVLNAR